MAFKPYLRQPAILSALHSTFLYRTSRQSDVLSPEGDEEQWRNPVTWAGEQVSYVTSLGIPVLIASPWVSPMRTKISSPSHHHILESLHSPQCLAGSRMVTLGTLPRTSDLYGALDGVCVQINLPFEILSVLVANER
jgi:hypothetical protein